MTSNNAELKEFDRENQILELKELGSTLYNRYIIELGEESENLKNLIDLFIDKLFYYLEKENKLINSEQLSIDNPYLMERHKLISSEHYKDFIQLSKNYTPTFSILASISVFCHIKENFVFKCDFENLEFYITMIYNIHEDLKNLAIYDF